MEKWDIEITTKIKITAEDIDDIIDTAFNGGINYWCRSAEVKGGKYLGEYASEQISRGGTLILYDAEEDEKYELTLEKMLNGIKMAVEQRYYQDYDWCNGSELDCCMVDADVSDVIVQMAIFGEVVYG